MIIYFPNIRGKPYIPYIIVSLTFFPYEAILFSEIFKWEFLENKFNLNCYKLPKILKIMMKESQNSLQD